jgi:hypothetical protein
MDGIIFFRRHTSHVLAVIFREPREAPLQEAVLDNVLGVRTRSKEAISETQEAGGAPAQTHDGRDRRLNFGTG